MNIRNLAAGLSAVLALTMLVVGFGASPAIAQSTFTARPQGGIKGALLPNERQLWTYDAATGKYVVVPGDASGQYTPNLRKPAKHLTFAFAEGWAAIPFSVSINKGIYRIAKDLGIDIIYCDQEFKPEKAKIPVVTIDVWHPNAIFFGADNYVSGNIGGKAAGNYAKGLGKCGEVTLFNGINPGEGEAANQRIAGFIDGVQEICGAVPADRIKQEIFDAGTTEQALTKTTDWLTANPGASFILGTSIDDARSAGMAKAMAQSGRDGAAVALGCDEIGIASTKQGDA